MNLFEMINNLHNNDTDYWDYYRGITVNPVKYPQRAYEFINEFFTLGSKDHIFRNEFDHNDNGNLVIEHNAHTIKVFFIGIYLQKQLERELSIYSNAGTNYPFSYLWYLSCLFHDYGYRYEQKILSELHYAKMERAEEKYIGGFRNFRLDYYKILHAGIGFVSPDLPFRSKCYLSNRFSFSIARNKTIQRTTRINDDCTRMCEGAIAFSNGTNINQSHYSNKTKNNYLKYIMFEHKHIDHGISGADYMYFRLVENYRKKSSTLQPWESPMNFIDNNYRHFNCEQFKVFAYIADCIACHNIWKAPKNSENLYEKYQLESLIGEKFKIVSFKNNPLLFVLCLADSIEPTKKINNIDEVEVLKNIEFDYCAQINELKVYVTKELSKNDKCKEYIENLMKLKDWLDIKVIITLV